MKKRYLLGWLLLVAGLLPCFGQTVAPAPFYLSRYTFSDDQLQLGEVKLRDSVNARIQSIKVSGPNAEAFRVDKQHRLSIRKEKLPAASPSLDVVLTVKTSAGERKDTIRIVRDTFIRNKVIAHRGAWKNTGATENSLAALQHAVRLGCEGSEFDVHMSADSVLFVNHDPHIQGISIAKSHSSQLRGLQLSNGENLPTLTDYLKTGSGQTRTRLILEIKASELGKASSLALTRKVVALVERMRLQGWVDYISFDYDVCREVMKMAPYAKVAYLMGDKSPAELAQANFYGLDYHFSILRKNPDWLTQAQERKLTVNVWTVNEQAMLEELLRQNVDFITTNEPELLLKLVAGK